MSLCNSMASAVQESTPIAAFSPPLGEAGPKRYPRPLPTAEKNAVMTRTDMERVQAYLRGLFGCERIRVVPPPKPGLPVELAVGDEVVGTLYQDREDGEVSYAVQLTVLEEDLPPVPAASPRPAPRRAH
jgi:hypothetical protein